MPAYSTAPVLRSSESGRATGRCMVLLGMTLVSIVRGGPVAGGAASETLTAVVAATSPEYSRERLADGSFKDEFYAFGEGGYFGGAIRDPSIDRLGFAEVARVLAAPLARQHYLPSLNQAGAKLLIIVYWGMTSGTADPRADIQQKGAPPLGLPRSNQGIGRTPIVPGVASVIHPGSTVDGPDMILTDVQSAIRDAQNAALLGYNPNLMLPAGYQLTARRTEHDDMVEEVEHNRYFVVLFAYDFQLLWHQHKSKILWQARFSIRQDRNRFDEMLPRMASYSAQYFGQDTRGLIRRPLPQTKVEIGTPHLVASAPDPDGPIRNTALLAGSRLTSDAGGAHTAPPALPVALSSRIASYQADKLMLQGTLAEAIAGAQTGEDKKAAIDRFNIAHETQIARLQRTGEEIRMELGKLAATRPGLDNDVSIASLRRQFTETVDSNGRLPLHP